MALNAFERLRWTPSPGLLREMEKRLERAARDRDLVGARLVQALNSLAHLNHRPGPSFFAALSEAIVEQREFLHLHLPIIAVILWSLSALDPPEMQRLYSELVEVACRRLEGQQPDPLPANLENKRALFDPEDGAGAMAVGDYRNSPMIVRLRQFLQVCQHLTTLEEPIDANLQRRLARLVEQRWAKVKQEKREPTTSSFQREVQRVLERSLGLRCEAEVEDGAFMLDIVIHPGDGGLPVVVEVDGPHHFFRNAPEEPMGFTRFKHRLLGASRERLRGVVSVSGAEWLRAKGKGGQRALLVEKLGAAGLAVGVEGEGKGEGEKEV